MLHLFGKQNDQRLDADMAFVTHSGRSAEHRDADDEQQRDLLHKRRRTVESVAHRHAVDDDH